MVEISVSLFTNGPLCTFCRAKSFLLGILFKSKILELNFFPRFAFLLASTEGGGRGCEGGGSGCEREPCVFREGEWVSVNKTNI